MRPCGPMACMEAPPVPTDAFLSIVAVSVCVFVCAVGEAGVAFVGDMAGKWW